MISFIYLFFLGWHIERKIPEDWWYKTKHSYWSPLWEFSRYAADDEFMNLVWLLKKKIFVILKMKWYLLDMEEISVKFVLKLSL